MEAAVLLICLLALPVLFYAAFKLSAKIVPGVIWAQVLLTIAFGMVFNVAFLTAAVAGCIAIAGSPNFR